MPWFRVVGDVYDRHRAELEALDEQARLARMVEINVSEQLDRLARLPLVRAAVARGQRLTLHAWVYGLADGLLRQISQLEVADLPVTAPT